MFSKAYEVAAKFTHPVIISTRNLKGEVKCGCGAYILLNADGWILTAAHIFESYIQFEKQKPLVDTYRENYKKISNDNSLTIKQKNKKIKKISCDPNWITNHSFWWGGNNIKLDDIKMFPLADLMTGRLQGLKVSPSQNFPALKDPKKLKVGTFLCKLGFPFYEIKATFNEVENKFTLAKNTLPLPFFPIEGMYSRNLFYHKKGKDDKIIDAKFIETSSPGLKGQSGGPIFDKDGVVWALQVRTHHYALGFNPTIKKQKKDVEEHQFLNVGVGVHVETIYEFLNNNKVAFNVSD